MDLKRYLEELKGRANPPAHDPELPPCPLCGAPAFRGGDFRAPHRIEHDCDCIYREPEAYGKALFALWPRWWWPRAFREGLPPQYQAYLERSWEGPRAVLEALEAWYEKGKVLYIHGPPGTGKTHLAVRLGYRLAQEGKRTLFLGESAFYARARREALEEGAVRLLDQVDALVLDDLGKARLTPFAARSSSASWRPPTGGSSGSSSPPTTRPRRPRGGWERTPRPPSPGWIGRSR
jgi:DNA replication protein